MIGKSKTLLFFMVLTFFTLTSVVYAEDSVDLTDFPQQLATQLNMSLLAGQILATAIVVALCIFVPVLAQNLLGTSIMAIIALTFCIALTWIPYWMLIMVAILIALMVARSFQRLSSGGN